MHCLCCKLIKIAVLKSMCILFYRSGTFYFVFVFVFLLEQGGVCFPLGIYFYAYYNISNIKIIKILIFQ